MTIKTKTLNNLMNEKYPEQEYIVDRIVPESSITILSGSSRSFKTYTLLEIALSVAKGTTLFGIFKTQKCAVLIIDEENGERLLQKRLFQLGANVDLPIYISSMAGYQITDSTVEQTIQTCKEKEVKLVIVDALIRIHDSDENSAREMSKVFAKIRKISDAGIAVLLTQHHRKQGAHSSGGSNEMRGSSDILAAVDSHIGVTRNEKFYLRFDQTKQRYDVEIDPFEVKVIIDEFGFSFEYVGALQVSIDKSEVLKSAITNLLLEHKKLRQMDILLMLGELDIKTNEHTLRSLLERWITEGHLAPPQSGSGNTKYYLLKDNENHE